MSGAENSRKRRSALTEDIDDDRRRRRPSTVLRETPFDLMIPSREPIDVDSEDVKPTLEMLDDAMARQTELTGIELRLRDALEAQTAAEHDRADVKEINAQLLGQLKLVQEEAAKVKKDAEELMERAAEEARVAAEERSAAAKELAEQLELIKTERELVKADRERVDAERERIKAEGEIVKAERDEYKAKMEADRQHERTATEKDLAEQPAADNGDASPRLDQFEGDSPAPEVGPAFSPAQTPASEPRPVTTEASVAGTPTGLAAPSLRFPQDEWIELDEKVSKKQPDGQLKIDVDKAKDVTWLVVRPDPGSETFVVKHSFKAFTRLEKLALVQVSFYNLLDGLPATLKTLHLVWTEHTAGHGPDLFSFEQLASKLKDPRWCPDLTHIYLNVFTPDLWIDDDAPESYSLTKPDGHAYRRKGAVTRGITASLPALWSALDNIANARDDLSFFIV